MSRLFYANLSRLKRDKAFLFCSIAVFICSVITILNGCLEASVSGANTRGLDEFFFNMTPVIGIFLAVLSSMFLGTEYNDGTIRNKLMVGHRRNEIYLANLAACLVASLAFNCLWFVGGMVGIPFLGIWQMSLGQMLMTLTVMLFYSVSTTAIMALIGMSSSSKAFSAVASLVIYLAMLMGASVIYNALSEPETLRDAIITSGGIAMGEPALNPNYISGSLRVAYELLCDLLPTGQSIQMSNLEALRPLREIGFSVILTALATFGGILIFKRKNIK